MITSSIRHRLQFAFIGLVAISVLLTGGVLGLRNYQGRVADAHTRQLELVRRVAIEVQSSLQNIESHLDNSIRVTDFPRLTTPERKRLASRLLVLRDHYRELRYIDASGREQLHLSNVRMLDSAHQEARKANDEFRMAMQTGKTYLGPLYYSSSDNEPLMQLGFPVKDVFSGTLDGAFLAEIRFKPVWQTISALVLESGEDVYLLDQNNFVIAHRNPSLVLKQSRMQLLPDDSHQTGLRGNTVFLASQAFTFGQQTFRVVAERDAALALTPAFNDAKLTALALALALLSAFALLLPLTRRITRPVIAVANAARELSEGRLEQQVRVESDDEIGELARSFNNMAVQLRQNLARLHEEIAVRSRTEAELERHRNDLEGVVKERTKELLHQQAFTAAVLDNISDGVVACDAQGSLSIFNRATREMHGIDREDVPPELWASRYRLLKADGKELMQKEDVPLFRAFSGEQIRDVEFVIERADGCKLSILSSGQPMMDHEGHKIGAVVMMRDISLRKRIEAELIEARDRAEAANRAKSIFLTSMSHELRTPLNAILGFSSLMRQDTQLRPEQRTNLDIINRSGEHLLILINDILELAKIEAGKTQINIAPFDLGALVRDVSDMMEIRAREKGLRLLLVQSSQFPRYIKADEARLRQILINLLGNAVKFTEQGGVTLRLGIKQNTIAHLIIEIEDTGPGISAEDQQRLFQPFMQFGKQAGDNKGTGLGLSITHQFVQLMGGNISVESTPGKGSLFRVDLPLSAAEENDLLLQHETEQGEVASLAPDQPVYRILIVEDQKENQLLLSQLMQCIGFEVKVAEDGKQGVQLFQSWHPHLIFMDRRMPVMDGIEATKAIRQLPGGKDVKIVAVTASAFMEQRDEMMAAGMDDFVRKPYRFSEIYDSLSRQLGVRYTYAHVPDSAEPHAVILTAAMLTALPPALRNELHDALISLDSSAISAALDQVAGLDLTLHRTLALLVDNYDYPRILQVLQTSASDDS